MKYAGRHGAHVALFSFLTLLACATASTSQAQQQLQVVAHVPDEPSHAVAVQDSIVFSGSDTSLVVLDIRDPDHPVELATLALLTRPNDLALHGDHLYVAGCHQTLTAVDIANPASLYVTDYVEYDWSPACVEQLAFRGDTVFVPIRAGTAQSYMWDISNPYDIRRLENFTSVTSGVAFTDSIFYSISSHGPWAARIVSWSPFDIEDQTWFPDVDATWAGVLENDHLFVVGAGGLYVYDTRQYPLSPALVAHMEELGSLHDLAVTNNRVYVVSTEGRGLLVLDVSDPTHPIVIARFEVPDARNVAVSDSLVFLSAGKDGLYVLRDATVTANEQPPAEIPKTITLDPPVPHPVSGQAVIGFHLPEPGGVRLLVYDMLGREVTQLIDGFLSSGSHEIRWESSGLAGGTYVLRLEAGSHRTSTSFAVVP